MSASIVEKIWYVQPCTQTTLALITHDSRVHPCQEVRCDDLRLRKLFRCPLEFILHLEDLQRGDNAIEFCAFEAPNEFSVAKPWHNEPHPLSDERRVMIDHLPFSSEGIAWG